jgi:FkbM family methyltransferase
MDNSLVFDVGMHMGEDTIYYLKKGFRVVGIDADPSLVESAKNCFSNYLKTNQLVLLNFAISDKDNEEIDFHISRVTAWSSLQKSISDRHNLYKETIKVKSKRLSSLMIEFGVPYYCKIDVEAYDRVCLETLSDLGELPKFGTVETECLGEFDTITEEQALATLDMLHRLGYRKFKLVDQKSLSVLEPDEVFYKDWTFDRILRKLKVIRILRKLKVIRTNRDRLGDKFKFAFPPGSTGPFGEELNHRWLDYDIAKRTLLFHRKSYMKLKEATNYGFWCDWHAKLER